MPVLEQVLEQYPEKVKLVIKNFPLGNHKFSFQAALAALAAQRQGKYWEYHELLHLNYKKLNNEKILELASVLKMDMEKFQKDTKDLALRARVNQDMKDGRQAGVRGTPTVFINGRNLRNRSLQGFKAMIDEELAKNK